MDRVEGRAWRVGRDSGGRAAAAVRSGGARCVSGRSQADAGTGTPSPILQLCDTLSRAKLCLPVRLSLCRWDLSTLSRTTPYPVGGNGARDLESAGVGIDGWDMPSIS